jgi:hypothetical protein
MQFKLLAFVAALTSVMAAPADSGVAQVTILTLFRDVGFSGPVSTYTTSTIPTGCRDVDAAFNDLTSAAKPLAGTTCVLFRYGLPCCSSLL